jgi:GntR family transcriptional regulator
MNINNWEINKSSPLPYYYQLERFLRSEIDRGNYKENDVLPSEGTIASSCNVSLGVVRQTLRRLEQNGVIIRQKGKKAVIKNNPKFQIEFSHKQYGGYEDLERQGFKVRTKVLENCVVESDDKLSKKLRIDKDARTIKIIRIRYVEDHPVIFWITYVPLNICPGLESADLSDKSLNAFVLTHYNIKTQTVECALGVVHGDQTICSMLHNPIDEPLIYIESINYLKDNRVFQYSEAWHTSENWNFIFHLYPGMHDAQ